MTRLQALKHLLTEVLGKTEDDTPWTVISKSMGCTNISTFARLDKDVLEGVHEVRRRNDEGALLREEFQLNIGELSDIKDLQALISEYPEYGVDEWLEYTAEEFEEYQDALVLGITAGNPTGAPATPAPADEAYSSIEKPYVMKRDFDHYSELQQRHFWNGWLKEAKGIAVSHRAEKVFDPTYVPSTDMEKAIFRVDSTFVFNVLRKKIKYPSGKKILNKLTDVLDGQTALIELNKEATSENVKDINVTKLENNLRGMRAKDGMNTTLEKFIDTWETRLTDYEMERGTSVSEEDKRKWLRESIAGHPELQRSFETQRTTEINLRHMNPNFGRDFSFMLEGLRVTAQNVDNADRKHRNERKQSGGGGETKANKSNREANNSNFNQSKGQSKEEKQERFEKHKKRLLEANLWVEPAVFNTWDKTKKDQHAEKCKEHFKKGNRKVSQATGQQKESEEKSDAADKSPKVPGSINSALSQNQGESAPRSVQYMGRTYVINKTVVRYKASQTNTQNISLVDGGCNGGLAGADVKIIDLHPTARVAITGVNNTHIGDVPLCTAAGVFETTSGPVIGFMHQYAALCEGSSIHSPIQMRDYGVLIDDTPKTQLRSDGENGQQKVQISVDGELFEIPLQIKGGLPYLKMRPPTDDELVNERIKKINITSDMPWDPTKYDDIEKEPVNVYQQANNVEARGETGENQEIGYEEFVEAFGPEWMEMTDEEAEEQEEMFDTAVTTDPAEPDVVLDPKVDKCTPTPSLNAVVRNGPGQNKMFVEHKFGKTMEEFKPYLAWQPVDRVRATINASTQLFRSYQWTQRMKRHFNTRFPGANVPRIKETVCSDTAFMEVKGTNVGLLGYGGAEGFQLFVGKESKHLHVSFLKTDAEYPGILRDYIRTHGAPSKLYTDNARAETSKEVRQILREFVIADGTSEPHYQNQNATEREIQDVKKDTERIMNITNTPAGMWHLCVQYVVQVKNHTARAVLNDRTPLERRTGQTPDISKFLHFRWWEPVYFLDEKGHEKFGRWAGIADHVGDELTWIVISEKTGEAMYRSDVRTATNPKAPNLRAEAETIKQPAKKNVFKGNDDDSEFQAMGRSDDDLIYSPIASFDEPEKVYPYTPDDLIGKHFLLADDTGTEIRTEIVRALKKDAQDSTKRTQFLVRKDNGTSTAEEIMDYVELCDIISKQLDALHDKNDDTLHTFKEISAHEGPINPRDPRYKGSRYNLRIQWDVGEPTWEPLHLIAKDDPVSVAMYAQKNGLLKTKGWKWLKAHAKRLRKVMECLQSTLGTSAGTSANKATGKRKKGPQYKYGVRLPDYDKKFKDLDMDNGNTLWGDANKLELELLDKYKAFNDQGLYTKEKADELRAKGYQEIKMIMVYDVKHDGRRRARLVGAGNMTRPDVQDTYSTVVSLRTLRLALLLGELNGLKVMVGDITSAYLMAYTKEKIFFRAGPEFGDKEGHLFIVVKALYGLRSSGKAWHDLLFDTLTGMGFFPSKADPDIWMRDAGDCYEYVCSYVDDLTAIMKDPQSLFTTLEEKGFGLKGVTDEPDVFLGGTMSRDPDGTLVWGAKRYIIRALDNYERMIGQKPVTRNIPLPERCQPELDTTCELNEEKQSIYQSLIGALQWIVTLGRFDIACAVMTMSRFRTLPREGHLQLLGNVFGYLRKYPDGAIRFRTHIPMHETQFVQNANSWEKTVYGPPCENVPEDRPVPKGKPVRQSSWFDANLLHCLVTGRSAMGIFHMVNGTPIHCVSKRQSTVETATYASEFIAGRTCLDEALAIRYELQMLGAPLDGFIWMFGDNKSMIDSSSDPAGRLTKRHLILSWHRLREKAAMGIVRYFHVDGKENISDCLTKHLSHPVLWKLIKPVLFWRGDTAECTVNYISHDDTSPDNTVGEYQVPNEFVLSCLDSDSYDKSHGEDRETMTVAVDQICPILDDMTVDG